MRGTSHGRQEASRSRRRRPARASLPLVVAAVAAVVLAAWPGAAVAASSLGWSTPQLIDVGPSSEAIGLMGVSCTGPSFCVAVDEDGSVLTSTDPAGGAGMWSTAPVDSPNQLTGVSCASTEFCAAVDDAGNVLTSVDPASGIGAWTTTNLSGLEGFEGVSCPSAELCAAVSSDGKVVTSTDPTGGAGAWTTTDLSGGEPQTFTAIGCAPSTCVVGDSDGDFLQSLNPTGGALGWERADHIANGSIEAVSCPAESFCLAVAADGWIDYASHADFVEHAWNSFELTNTPLLGLSCTSALLCVATDSSGNAWGSTDPTATSSEVIKAKEAWTGLNVSPTALAAVSCTTTPLCVAVDGNGQAVIGTAAESEPPGVEGPSIPPVSELPISLPPPVPASPKSTKPLKCRKGFKKKRVRGKTKCVRIKKQRHRR